MVTKRKSRSGFDHWTAFYQAVTLGGNLLSRGRSGEQGKSDTIQKKSKHAIAGKWDYFAQNAHKNRRLPTFWSNKMHAGMLVKYRILKIVENNSWQRKRFRLFIACQPTITLMKITITSEAINNGKQHIIRVPFIGTFTVDQRDANRTIEFVLSHGKNESIGFLNAVAIK